MIIKLTDYGHDWDKINLVTQTKGGRSFDTLKCKKCGIQGRTIYLHSIELKDSYGDKIFECTGFIVPLSIEIIKCGAVGKKFDNLTPGSKHKVVDPLYPYKNDHTGVWVMGNGEKVKVLSREFKVIEYAQSSQAIK